MSQVKLAPLMALAVTLAIAACSMADQPAGRHAFERNCGSCHAGGKLPGNRATGLADPQKRAALDQFLARHHADDPAARAEIIEYLETQER